MKFQEDIEHRLTGRHKRCMRAVGNVRNKKILDIGCSFGWFEKFASENGCKEIIAIDTDVDMLSSAKRHIDTSNVRFMRGSATNLSKFKKDYFDIVVIFDVLEHVPKNKETAVFEEIKNVLKKNGLLVLSTPNKNLWSCLFDPAWYFGHRHYSAKEVSSFLHQSGFEVKAVRYGGGFYELFSMILLYLFKWFFKREIPFKAWFDKKRDEEYLKKDRNMFATLFLECVVKKD